jgi:hypothetical protein
MLTVPANGSISHVWVSKLPQKENGHVTKSFAVKEVKSPNERFFVSYVCGSATPGMRQKAPKPELHGHVHPYIWELLSIPPMRHAPVGLWPWLFTRGGGGIARSVPDRPNCGVAVVLRAMGPWADGSLAARSCTWQHCRHARICATPTTGLAQCGSHTANCSK